MRASRLLFALHCFVLFLLVTGLLLSLVGCAGILEGETARTLQQAAEFPPPPPKPAEPALPQRFDPAHGVLTGYRPRKVLPNGDATGGHFVDITTTETTPEIAFPNAHIPRAPKTVTQPSAKIRQPKPPAVESPPSPPADVPAALLPLLPPPAPPSVSINPHTGDLNGVVIAPR